MWPPGLYRLGRHGQGQLAAGLNKQQLTSPSDL